MTLTQICNQVARLSNQISQLNHQVSQLNQKLAKALADEANRPLPLPPPPPPPPVIHVIPAKQTAGNGADTQQKPGRRGFKLKEAFKIIGISQTAGHYLIKQGKINVIRLGPRLPLITQAEIDRIIKDGTQ